MTPAVLADLVRFVAADVLTRRGLDPAVLPATVTVQRPPDPHHGDYATTVALQTAPKVGVDPRELAGWLAEALAASPAVRCAQVAGPGFLNLRLATDARTEIIRQVRAAPSGGRYPELDPSVVAAAPGAELGAYGGPLRRVQYAHARLSSLARNAADLGITSEGAALDLLEHEREVELIGALGDFPRIAARGEPRRLVRYLAELAEHHHDFCDVCRMLPIGDEEPGPLHAARLALCEATRRVLAEGLCLLETTAPERM